MKYIAFSMYAFLNYISMHSIIFRTNGISFFWCVSGTFQKPSGKNSLDMITKKINMLSSTPVRKASFGAATPVKWFARQQGGTTGYSHFLSSPPLIYYFPVGVVLQRWRLSHVQHSSRTSSHLPRRLTPPLRPAETRERWIRLGLLILGWVEMLSLVSHRVVLCLRVDSCQEG